MPGVIAKIKRRAFSKLLIDRGGDERDTVFISGVGRSGTTWAEDIVNYKNDYRIIFEPFHPNRISALRAFHYHQYMRPHDDNPKLKKVARKVFSGKIRSDWSDSENTVFASHKRIVKDIRTNLMLGWVQKNFPEMPMIFLLRHPFAVANSWLKLGWGKEAGGTRSLLDSYLSQEELVTDYLQPFAQDIRNARDDFEKNVFAWAIMNFVALSQIDYNKAHIMFYEDLYSDSETEARKLMQFLDRPFDNKIVQRMKKPSRLSQQGSAIMTGGDVLEEWKKEISESQRERGMMILRLFGLDKLYDTDPMPHKEALQTFIHKAS